jgi:hypothetical protein
MSFVCIRQRPGDVAHDGNDCHRGQRTFAQDSGTQRLALDERHDEVDQAALVPRRNHRNDVRVLQRGRGEDFATEPLAGNRRRDFIRQHLHHYPSIQWLVERHEDARHATAAELALDLELIAQDRRQSLVEVRVNLHLSVA